jgi:hypothetical protein
MLLSITNPANLCSADLTFGKAYAFVPGILSQYIAQGSINTLGYPVGNEYACEYGYFRKAIVLVPISTCQK